MKTNLVAIVFGLYLHAKTFIVQIVYMDRKKQIVTKTLELFRRMGIRGVTMDMIAEHLGMSKRTLYEYFSSKNELVTQCMKQVVANRQKEAERIIAQSEHIIETYILFMRMHVNELKSAHPLFALDLKRHLPESICQPEEEFYTELRAQMVTFIQQGKEQGVFREQVNAEIVSRLILQWIRFFRSDVIEATFPHDQFSPVEVFEHITVNFIRGLATPKGLDYIDRYYEKHKMC